MKTRYKLVIEHDTDADFSWLEQDHYKPGHKDYSPIFRSAADMKANRNPIDPAWYTDPENHVALCMRLYKMEAGDDDWELANSLGGIDFLATSDDWTTGTFYRLSGIPKDAPYLRSLAKDMGFK